LASWALRRSELVALGFEDVNDHPQGRVGTIPRSKTNQEGLGAEMFTAGAERGSGGTVSLGHTDEHVQRATRPFKLVGESEACGHGPGL